MRWKNFSDIKKTIIISIIILLVQIPCFLISYSFSSINGAIRFISSLLSLSLQFVYMLVGSSWSIPLTISIVMYALLLGTIIFLIIKIAKKPQLGTETNKKKYWKILIAIIAIFVILYFLFVITGIAMVSMMRIDCTLRGQDWRKYWDGYGQTSCPRVYSDGGKICHSSDECEGDCLTNIAANLGVEGVCETDKKIRVICQNPVENKHLECRFNKDTTFICEPGSKDWDYNCLNFRDNGLVFSDSTTSDFYHLKCCITYDELKTIFGEGEPTNSSLIVNYNLFTGDYLFKQGNYFILVKGKSIGDSGNTSFVLIKAVLTNENDPKFLEEYPHSGAYCEC